MSTSPSIPPEPGDDGFRCEVARDDATATVLPIGELDIDTMPILRAWCARLRGDGMRHLVVDLRQLEFIDSSGVRCILDLASEARLDGFSLALIPGSRAVQRVFELTGTTTALPFVDARNPRATDATSTS